MLQKREIHVAAAMLTREDGKMLFVRKRGTSAFMQPGGKLEPGEEPVDALCRELREELDLAVERSVPRYLGRFTAAAANEPDHVVVADIFQLTIASPVVPAAEIEEIVWRNPEDPHAPEPLNLAPLTRDHVLPLWTTHVSAGQDHLPRPA
jgi:8-oxo-dGTP pyrophosphatase MutT (NUDIX family)